MDLNLPLWLYYVIGFPLLLGPLITVHELGHYLVGRWFGVHAEAFSIGFGKEVWGRTDSRGTRWKLSALPLGGYVQFKGDMNPASIPDPQAASEASVEERVGSFHHAALWKRALIVFAGPATNILLTLAIFVGFFAFYGKPNVEFPDNSTEVARFSEQSAARDAGVLVGDRIVAVDGERVEDFSQILDRVAMYPNRTIDLTVERGGGEISFPMTIQGVWDTDRFGNRSLIGRIGIYRPQTGEVTVTYEKLGVLESVPAAVDHSLRIMDMMITGIAQIITGDRSVQELGGPIKIAKFSGEQLSMGALMFVQFAALISLNLAFINLLPIPALDGGHLAFYAAEAVRRKPVGPRGTEVAYRAGVALVLMLMVFVTINDLVSLPFFGK